MSFPRTVTPFHGPMFFLSNGILQNIFLRIDQLFLNFPRPDEIWIYHYFLFNLKKVPTAIKLEGEGKVLMARP